MKKKQSVQSYSYLKTDLRKIRKFAVLTLWMLSAAFVQGKDCDVSAYLDSGEVIIDLSIPGDETPDLKAHLEKGQQSIIEFETRIYSENHGIKALFGDYLIEEANFTYKGRWDPLQEKYEVTIDDRNIYFDSYHRFLEFFTTYQHRMNIRGKEKKNIYVLGRTTIILSKLRPPFNFLSPLLRTLTWQSQWERFNL
jgi:hypothetical protein